MMRDFYNGQSNQSQEIYLTADVTPAVMRKALSLQGVLQKPQGLMGDWPVGFETPEDMSVIDNTSAINSTLSTMSYSTTEGTVPVHCDVQAGSPGTARSSRSMRFMPVIRGNGDILMYYAISSGLEIAAANAEDLPLSSVAPGSHITERTSISLIPQGQSIAVSGLRMQIKDRKTQTYADSQDNEVQIVVVTPTIAKK
jgi:hypothetical protein